MLNDWTMITILTAAAILLSIFSIWFVKGIRFSRGIILSASAALILFLLVLFLPQTLPAALSRLPGGTAFLQWLTVLAVILTINAVLELAKWTLVQFVVKPKRINMPRFLLDLAGGIVLVGSALLVVSKFFELELTGVWVSSTVVSAIIALSLQQILSSLFSGIALQIQPPYHVDDWVNIDGHLGKVIHQNWRTLAIRTPLNQCVLLPNGSVAQGKIINYSRPSPLVAHELCINVSTIHPPGRVKAVLSDVLSSVDGVLCKPPPRIIIQKYVDFSIRYQIRYWFADFPLYLELQDTIYTHIWYALERAGMHIPHPVRDVNLRVKTAERETAAQRRRKEQIEAALRSVDLFLEMTNEQIQHLARRSTLHSYTAGETLVREGDVGDSLFIIHTGHVDVYVAGDNGQSVLVAQRAAREFFGEMSLLTGEPRAASVVAAAETEVVIIDKQAFTEVLAADVTILERLLDALDRRRSALQSRLSEESLRQQQEAAPGRRALLQKIGSFLGIGLS